LTDIYRTDPQKITYDTSKRARVLSERGLDLADARIVFADRHIQILDDRRDYGEVRFRVFGSCEADASPWYGRREAALDVSSR